MRVMMFLTRMTQFLNNSVPQFFPRGYIALIVQSCFKLLYIIYYYIYIIIYIYNKLLNKDKSKGSEKN